MNKGWSKATMETSFENQLIEAMRYENKQRIVLEDRLDLLSRLRYLSYMMTGRADAMFCNGFITEAVQLLINAIFLYEDGNFDCAFYSLRQSSEVVNNMTYLSNMGTSELKKWNNKEKFPMNAKIEEEIRKIDENYREVQVALAGFFEEHNCLIKMAHKKIHKQGFETFYLMRTRNQCMKEFNKDEETQLFLQLLKSCIGKVLILYIVLDPLSLVLADEDLSARYNFDPLTEVVDVDFFYIHLSGDIIEKIKETSFYKSYSQSFAEKEKMLPAVFDVVRNDYFNIDLLSEIEEQKHLLNSYDWIILDILKEGVKITRIYPNCGVMCYFTSIKSNFSSIHWNLETSDQYLTSKDVCNTFYHNIFRSILKVFDKNWIFEHNEALSDNEISAMNEVIQRYNELYGRSFRLL